MLDDMTSADIGITTSGAWEFTTTDDILYFYIVNAEKTSDPRVRKLSTIQIVMKCFDILYWIKLSYEG